MIRDNIQPSNGDNLFGGVMRILLFAIGVIGLLVFVLSFFSPRITLETALVGLLAFVVSLLVYVATRKRS